MPAKKRSAADQTPAASPAATTGRCCSLRPEEGGCAQKDYLTPEELEALRAMRRIRDRAEPLRARLRDLTAPGDTARRRELLCQIGALRAAFSAARRAYAEANHAKMVRLGHAGGAWATPGRAGPSPLARPGP